MSRKTQLVQLDVSHETLAADRKARQRALVVACPVAKCGAGRGEKCRDVSGMIRPAHNKRVKAYQALGVCDDCGAPAPRGLYQCEPCHRRAREEAG
jgi:hypothetical protein